MDSNQDGNEMQNSWEEWEVPGTDLEEKETGAESEDFGVEATFSRECGGLRQNMQQVISNL